MAAEPMRLAFDGGSRGNPGPAAWGVVRFDADGAFVEGHGGFLGRATNNVAEYHGLVEALRWAVREGAAHVRIQADSELIVKQWRGTYRVRHPDLKPLYDEAVRLARRLGRVEIVHVRRESNRDADRMVNQALDRALDGGGHSVHEVAAAAG